jgi:hypothetical protein
MLHLLFYFCNFYFFLLINLNIINNIIKIINIKFKWGLGIGDWGLGIGDWGLGIGPNPQSPIPNPHLNFIYIYIYK